MNGLEIIRSLDTTAEEIADIIFSPCPPESPMECENVECRACWLSWLVTGDPATMKEPPGRRTAPDEEGLHPNLINYLRKNRRFTTELLKALSVPHVSAYSQ